jgi:hypothetical protein
MHFANIIQIFKMTKKIHGIEKHELGGNWVGGGILWTYSIVGSWFTSTNHRQFSNCCV